MEALSAHISFTDQITQATTLQAAQAQQEGEGEGGARQVENSLGAQMDLLPRAKMSSWFYRSTAKPR